MYLNDFSPCLSETCCRWWTCHLRSSTKFSERWLLHVALQNEWFTEQFWKSNFLFEALACMILPMGPIWATKSSMQILRHLPTWAFICKSIWRLSLTITMNKKKNKWTRTFWVAISPTNEMRQVSVRVTEKCVCANGVPRHFKMVGEKPF